MANEDNGNTQASTTNAAPAEPSMAEYAAMREAEIRGQAKPALASPAVAVKTEEPAAATEVDETTTAAATEETEEEGTTTAESATEEDPDKAIEDAHPAKKGIQKRFSEMTARQKELQTKADEAMAATEAANQRAAQAEAEANRLRAEAQAAQAAVPHVVEEADDPVPNRNDFDD